MRKTSTSQNAIYIRTSTEKQDKGRGAEIQLEACKALLSEHCLKDYTVFEDKAVSGRTLNRPGLKRLRREIEAGNVRVVVADTMDRLSRDGDDLNELLDEFGV